MAEYIERDDIYYTLKEMYCDECTDEKCQMCEYAKIMFVLDNLPIADVQPIRRGNWICNQELYYNGMAKCSCCNAEFYVEDIQALQGDAECVKYCPNCGADMRGDENG